LCPNHPDQKHPNLDINEEKGVFLCRACSWAGHLYEENYRGKGQRPEIEKKSEPLKKIDYEKLYGEMKEKADEYHKNLNDELRTFLREGRGLTNQVIEKYRIGYVKTHLKFGGGPRLTIPIRKDGKIVNIRFHSLEDEKPKDFPYIRDLPYATWLFPEDLLKNDELWLCEGELDALCVISHGLSAISVTGGAGSWREEFTELLKGKIVNIVYDNDEAGVKGSNTIEEKLLQAKVCRNVNNIRLNIKKDVTDWFVTFGKSVEELKELRPKTIKDVILQFKDFKEMKLPEKRIILNPWIKEQSIILISGWRGVGKTWLALSLLDSITRGKNFGPWETKNPVPCLYLDGEMAGPDIQNRYMELNPNAEDIQPFYIYSEYFANLNGVKQANLSDERWRAEIKRILLEKGIKLWVIDNISSLAPGIDENTKKDWDPINKFLIELRFAGITTILIHHTGKEGDQRGTSAREDNIDVSINLKRPVGYSSEEGAKFILSFSKTRISFQQLSAITDTEFELTRDEKNKLIWLWSPIKKKLKDKILEMFDHGMSNQEIADAVGKSKGYVSQVKSRAIEEKFLTKKNKLTEKGQLSLFGKIKD